MRWLRLVVPAVVIFAAALFFLRFRSGPRPEFRTQSCERGDLLISVNATGTVEPQEIIDVGAQIVGIIKQFGPDPDRPGKTIDYRSRVTQGAILAQLDDLPHRAQLSQAQANLRLAEAELKRARARCAQAERELRRAEKLRDTNSEAEYENRKSDHDIVLAELAMAEAKVEQARVSAQQAEINLGYATVYSPVDGVVIDRRVNIGQTVVAGLNAPSLFLLAKDLTRMTVWAAVNEADIADVRVGQRVTFSVDAHRGRTFDGKVSQIRLNASLANNVVTYGVVIDVDNQDGALLPYMTAKIDFEVARRTDAMLVPDQALRWRPTWDQVTPSARAKLTRPTPAAGPEGGSGAADAPGQEPTVATDSPTVWALADDGLVRPIPVQIGLSDGIRTEVLDASLQPGNQVVIAARRETKPDFVSGFISKVVKKE